MLNKKPLIVTLIVLSFLIFIYIFSESIRDPFVKTSVESGEEIFNQSCIQCHGNQGEVRKINTATTLNNPEFLSLATDEFLLETISEGRDGTKMPAFHIDYGGSLLHEQIEDVIAYMRSWDNQKVEMETPDKTVTDPDQGRDLYKNNCLSCHGNGVGPAVVNKAFLEQVSNEFLWDTIAYGRSNTAMGPSLEGAGGVRQLTQNEISAIVSYLRSIED